MNGIEVLFFVQYIHIMIFEQPPKLLEHKLLEPNYFINKLLDFFFFLA